MTDEQNFLKLMEDFGLKPYKETLVNGDNGYDLSDEQYVVCSFRFDKITGKFAGSSIGEL